MSNAASNLGDTVKAMRPMVPAKDYEISKRFYRDLEFQSRQLAERLFEMQLGTFWDAHFAIVRKRVVAVSHVSVRLPLQVKIGI